MHAVSGGVTSAERPIPSGGGAVLACIAPRSTGADERRGGRRGGSSVCRPHLFCLLTPQLQRGVRGMSSARARVEGSRAAADALTQP